MGAEAVFVVEGTNYRLVVHRATRRAGGAYLFALPDFGWCTELSAPADAGWLAEHGCPDARNVAKILRHWFQDGAQCEVAP